MEERNQKIVSGLYLCVTGVVIPPENEYETSFVFCSPVYCRLSTKEIALFFLSSNIYNLSSSCILVQSQIALPLIL